MFGRRALIVIDAVLACLFLLVGIVNFVVVDPVSTVGGISALAVGACAAVTACLFVVFGGWSAKDAYDATVRRPEERRRQAGTAYRPRSGRDRS